MKKFLSLVLALVMAMSLVTISAGATEYKDLTDKSTITYSEAVAVMNKIGIISGYTDGAFKPTATLTRGAAAKIIAYLNLGTDAANTLTCDSAPYSDVKTSDTFAPFIAYCKNAKLIDGYADGTFKAGNSLTGFQFAKMLLTSLGYKSDVEGFTGANWSINVAKLAVKIGLFKGNDSFVGTTAVTREQACQYALNTLKATEVYYETAGTSISIGGATISIGGSSAKEVTTASDTGTISGTKDSAGTVQFAEDHFSKLSLGATNTTDDSFGRPAHTWTYTDNGKSTKIGTYASTPAYTFVADKAIDAGSVNAYVQKMCSNTSLTLATVYQLNGAGAVADASLTGGLKIGDTVQVYVSDTNSNTVQHVVIARYATYKVLVNPNTNVSATDKDSGVNYYTSLAGQTTDKAIPGFNASTYVKDAIVAVALKLDGTILDSYLATSVQGAITSYTGSAIGSASAIYVAGTKYTTSGSIANNISSVSFGNGVYKLYLDKNGYVLQADTVTGTAAITDVYYVVTTYATADATYGTTNYNVFAQRVALDGKSDSVQIGSLLKATPVVTTDYAAGGNFNSTGAAKYYTVTDGAVAQVTTSTAYDADKSYYTLDTTATASLSTGLYTFAAVSGKSYSQPTAYTTNSAYTISNPSNTTLKTSTTKFGGSYINSSTQFILVYGSKGDLKATTYAGAIALDSAKMSGTNVAISTKDSNGNLTAAYVIIPTNDKSLSVSTSDLLYSYSQTYSFVSSSAKTVPMYKMDGTKVDVKIGSSATVDLNKFYTYAVDSDGVYTLTAYDECTNFTASDFKSGVEMGGKFISLYGSLLTANENSFNDLQTSSATVIDLRSDDAKAASLYKGTINTVESMQAVKEVGGTVVFDAYVTSDGVQLIFVSNVLSNSATMSALSINTTAAKLYDTAAAAAAGDKVTIAKDTAITLSGATMSAGASAAYTIDGNYSTTFSSDGTLVSGTTHTTAAGSCTDVVCIAVTSADGLTTTTYYTAITVGA